MSWSFPCRVERAGPSYAGVAGGLLLALPLWQASRREDAQHSTDKCASAPCPPPGERRAETCNLNQPQTPPSSQQQLVFFRSVFSPSCMHFIGDFVEVVDETLLFLGQEFLHLLLIGMSCTAIHWPAFRACEVEARRGASKSACLVDLHAPRTRPQSTSFSTSCDLLRSSLVPR